MIIRESVKVGDKEITIETGRIAKQASGSVLVSSGETMVLVTVVGNKEARPGAPFFPLTCDYVEKTYAAGKIPGGFFKREARQRDHEILTCRLIDRPCRPLFPDGYMCETQVIATVISADGSNQSDVLAMVGASAAIHISPIPWAGPIAGVRVARVDGKLIANPTYQEQENSECELIVAASKDAIVMVEGEAKEMSETDLIEAIQFGHQAVQGVLELIEKIREAVGKEKWAYTPHVRDTKIDARVKEAGLAKVIEACNIAEKHPRYGRFSEIKKEVVAELASEFPDLEGDIKGAYEDLRYNTMRGQVLDEKRRVDGRDYKTVRPIAIEVALLPRVHGSTLFTRGETQSIVTATLGTRQDEQKIDGLTAEYYKPFLLHYNFPPYSVGETKFLRGPRPSRDRARNPRGARPDQGASLARRLPLHDPNRLGDHRIERLVVDGNRVWRKLGDDGCGCPHQGPGRRCGNGSHHGGREVRRPDRHPRRRGSSRRHGLQGLRNRQGHHRHPDGHQDRRPEVGDHARSLGAGARRTAAHPREDERGHGDSPPRTFEVRASHRDPQGQTRPDPRDHRDPAAR